MSKKYTVRILYDVKGWAYYHRAVALQKYAPDDFEITIGPDYGKALREKKHDLILQLAYSYTKDVRMHCKRAGYRNMVVAASYNVGWGYQNKWLDATLKYADAVIINNYEMYAKAGKKPKTYHISNGVDQSIFQNKVAIKRRRPKVLWVGSNVHRKIKGYQNILVPLQGQLKRKGIDLELKLTNSMGKKKLTLPQMAQWYNTGRIYVVASEYEGTPNPALEAASCGCVVVSTNVGNMPELIKHGENGFLCQRNTQNLYNHIVKANNNNEKMSDNMSKTIQDWNWKKRSKQFYSLFRKLIDARR